MKRIVIALLPLVLLVSFSLSAQEVVTSDQAVSINTPQWRIGLQVGGAYRLASADNSNSVLKEHYKKLKKGYTYGADATRFFNDYFGIGVKYHDLHCSHSEYVTATYDDGSTESGRLSDDLDISFIGPFVSCRRMSNSGKFAWYFNIGAGYMGYRDNAMAIDSYKINGGTIGFWDEAGLDYCLTEKLSIGASFYVANGTLTSCKLKEGTNRPEKVTLSEDERIGLGHIGLSIGARLCF